MSKQYMLENIIGLHDSFKTIDKNLLKHAGNGQCSDKCRDAIIALHDKITDLDNLVNGIIAINKEDVKHDYYIEGFQRLSRHQDHYQSSGIVQKVLETILYALSVEIGRMAADLVAEILTGKHG